MNMDGSSSSQAIPVTAIWNQKHAQLPSGYDISVLKSNIQVALKQHNPDFFVEEIIAMGHDTGYQFPDGFTFSPIPRENLRYPGEHTCEHDNTQADQYVVHKMFMKSLEQKKYILIITGDGDNYVSAMKGLSGEGDAYVMVAQPEGSSGELHRVTRATWIWKSDNPEAPTMIKGGPPTHRKGSMRRV